jgi:hypothetical protein
LPVLPERQFRQSASLLKCYSVLPERQFASFARAPVLPECQFCQFRQFTKVLVSNFARAPVCQSASFARAPVSPERQFTKVLVSFARAPVLPERQFCQSASLPVANKGIRCFSFKPYHILNLTKRTALFQIIKTEITLTQKKMLKYIAIYD